MTDNNDYIAILPRAVKDLPPKLYEAFLDEYIERSCIVWEGCKFGAEKAMEVGLSHTIKKWKREGLLK
jgi:hypothetical protein